MLRISLAFLSVALLASTARAQMRGGGAGVRAMSGMSAGACVSGSNSPGTTSSSMITANGVSTNATGFGMNAANGVSTNATGFGMSVAAANGLGGTSNASMSWAGYGTNANTAATYGMGAYGVTASSNPYAQVNDAYGNPSGGFGAMNGMNGGADFAENEFSLLSAQYAAEIAAAGWASTDTTPRTRSKSVKSKSKLKHRSKRTKGTPD